jgi:Domain of unknown function (DUF6916)
MSTTRRKFLKASMLGAVFVLGPGKSVFSQSGQDLDQKGALAKENNVLGNYSKAAFSSYVNSIFELQTASGVVEVTLLQVGDLPSSKNGECFSLLFRGGRGPLKQDTYVLKHASLGTFALLLVPTDTDRNGAQGYLATINRLSFGDVLNNPAPSRSRSTKPSVRSERD